MKKGFIFGMVTMLVIFLLIPSSLAVGIHEQIQVLLNQVNVQVDGQSVGQKGDKILLDNGSEVPFSILYEGTTYMPVRRLSEVLGLKVGWISESETVTLDSMAVKRPHVTIEFENYQPITLELYPEIAPNTVNNFIDLAEAGYYDGLKFHRVIKDFMIQGGDPIGNGTGGPGYTIDGEFSSSNGPFKTYLSHERGVISMARSADVNSAGSQFFIVHKDSEFLDMQYAAFGKVIDNIGVVDSIANLKTDTSDAPEEDVIIKYISVDLRGYTYTEPLINQ